MKNSRTRNNKTKNNKTKDMTNWQDDRPSGQDDMIN